MTPASPLPTPPPSVLAQAKGDYALLRGLVLALLVVACAEPLAFNVVDPDLWGHVRYGQDWLADGHLHRTATHTYTAEGHPWVNHENLAELALAAGYATLGVSGLLIAKLTLGLAVLGLMWRVAQRQGVRPLAAWALFLLVAHNLKAFFPLRPQLLSFLLCALMLYALDRAFAGWGDRRNDFRHTRRGADPRPIHWAWLACLPVLFVVWANAHGGFAAGLAIATAVLLGRAVTLVVGRRPGATRASAGLLGVATLCGLATLLTPYGVELHAWMLGSLGTARPEITEWLPPSLASPVFWPFVSLAAIAVGALAFTERRRDPVQTLLLVLVGWQAASHLRHIAFFAILCGFWLPVHVQSIAGRLRRQAARDLPLATLTPRTRRLGAMALTALLLVQGLIVGGRLSALPVPRSQHPVDALQWLAMQNAHGRMIVCFNWAQYAIAALAPDMKVSFDGRFRTCYPQSVIDRHFDWLLAENCPRNRDAASGPMDPFATLTTDRPDYVLVDRRFRSPVRVMAEASSAEGSPWVLVYQDAVAQVWGHRGVVDDPASDRYVQPAWRLVSEHRSTASVNWPALPRDLGSLAELIAPAETPPTPDEVARRTGAADPDHEG